MLLGLSHVLLVHRRLDAQISFELSGERLELGRVIFAAFAVEMLWRGIFRDPNIAPAPKAAAAILDLFNQIKRKCMTISGSSARAQCSAEDRSLGSATIRSCEYAELMSERVYELLLRCDCLGILLPVPMRSELEPSKQGACGIADSASEI